MGRERRVKTKHLGQQCCVEDYAFVAMSVYGIKKRKKNKQTDNTCQSTLQNCTIACPGVQAVLSVP